MAHVPSSLLGQFRLDQITKWGKKDHRIPGTITDRVVNQMRCKSPDQPLTNRPLATLQMERCTPMGRKHWIMEELLRRLPGTRTELVA